MEAALRLRNRPGGGLWLERAVQWGAILISLGLVLRSLVIIHDNFLEMQAFDQWNLVAAMATDFASVFKPAYFFKHQNEHIIATSHVFFVLDYLLFDMTNVLLVTLIAVFQLAIAGLVARTACGDMTKAWALTFAAVSSVAMLSIAQWHNLISGFQIQFPLFLLSGMCAVLTVDWYIDEAVSLRRRVAGLAVILSVGLCIFSFATGVVIGGVLIFVLVIRRAKPSAFFLVGIAWVIFLALFFADYHPGSYGTGRRSPGGLVLFCLSLIGSPFSIQIGISAVAGFFGVVLFTGLAVHFVFQPYLARRPVDRRSLALVAFCLIALAFATTTAWGRVRGGLDGATSSRYTTPAFFFWIGAMGLLLRFLAQRPWPELARRATLSLTIVAALSGFALSTFRPDANMLMRGMVDAINAGAFFALNDVPYLPMLKRLYFFDAEEVRRSYPFLRRARLSLFAPSTGWYVPPDIADPLHLPSCPRGWIDKIESVTPGGWAIRGWALRLDGTANPEWMLAFDGTGHRVGFTRALVYRPELRSRLNVEQAVSGFYLPVKLPLGHVPGSDLTLVAVDGEQPDRACRLAGAVGEPPK